MANRTVSVALVADVGQYQSAMTRAAATTRTVGDNATTAGTRAERGFAAAGKGAVLLGGLAGGALTIGLKSAVDAAADAEQSIGGVESVFKSYARTVIADSKAADRALGLSANSYRELATVIGSQLKNAGVPMDQLADKTEGLVTMGADLAAMFGGTTEEAVRALSSALKGEMDPIEAYGISLNDAALKAEAASLGLEVMGGSLTNSQRAMAVMSAVTKQGADAVGAFGRESDTAAGRAQRAAAQWDNLKVTLGDELLPLWSGLVSVLGEQVIPALGDVVRAGAGAVGFLGELAQWAGDNTPIVAALGSVLAIQLAGGITAVTVAANRFVLTPVVLGLSSLLTVAGSLPAALGAASAAVGRFMASMAPLVAIGAVVGAATAIWDIANAGSNARDEVAGMWAVVENASRGTEQVQALADHIDHLRVGIAEMRANLADDGAWETTILGAWLTGAAEDQAKLDAYTAALKRAEEAQDMVEASASVMSRRFGLTTDQVLDLASKYDIDLTGSMSNTFRLMQNFYAMEFGAKPTEAVIGVSNAFEDAKTSVDEAKKAVDMFKLSLDILTGANVSLMQTEAAVEAAIDDAAGALEGMNGVVLDAAGMLNLQTEAGRKTFDSLNNMRDAANLHIATMIEQGATAEEVRAEDARLRQSFYDTALAMTGSATEAQRLTDKIFGIPAERETKIDADTQAAQDKIRGVQSSIDNLKGRTVEVQVRAAGRFIVNPQGGLQEFGGPDVGRDFAGKVPGYMRGGWTGPGPADQVAGLAHADEFVVPKHRVNALGGPSAVASLVGMGGDIGGPVPLTVVHDTRHLESSMEQVANAMRNAAPAGLAGVPAGGGSLGGSFQSLFAAVKAAFPAARLNSGYRPGDPGYHGRRKAADIGLTGVPGGNGNAFMARVNQWLYDNHRGSLSELIYNGLGDSRPNVKNSRDFAYSAATQAQHRNHVHAAVYDQGGPLYPGLTLAYNGTGKTEWVSREMSGTGGTTSSAPSSAPRTVIHDNRTVVAQTDPRQLAKAMREDQRDLEYLHG